MYYRGQRLTPSSINPIRYSPHDFAIFEGLEPDGKLRITVVQRRMTTEPADWWVGKESSPICQKAQPTEPVSVKECLAILHELAPMSNWVEKPEPLNPYRFQDETERILELDSQLINATASLDGLRSLIADILRSL